MKKKLDLDLEISQCFYKGNNLVEISEYLISQYGPKNLTSILGLAINENFENELLDKIDTCIAAIKILNIIEN